MRAFNQEGEVQAIELCQLITWHQELFCSCTAGAQGVVQPLRGAICLSHLQILLCPSISEEDLVHTAG